MEKSRLCYRLWNIEAKEIRTSHKLSLEYTA